MKLKKLLYAAGILFCVAALLCVGVWAVDTPAPVGLTLNKTAAGPDVSGNYTVTLETYTTGTVISTQTTVPCDIVLVLDESGSMADEINSYIKVYTLDNSKSYYYKNGDSYYQVNYCSGGVFSTHKAGWYTGFHFGIHFGSRYDPMTSVTDTTAGHVQFYEQTSSSQTKQAALISAAKDFVNSVYNNAKENNVDHRIAVVGFATNSSIKIGLTADIRNNKDDVVTAISGIAASGGTYIEKGLANAKQVFDYAVATTNTQRNRVVIIFTDGIPGSGTWGNDTINNSANPAIATAQVLKGSDYGATVYTIGMLNDANPTIEISDAENDTARTNKFLHYLSSNYPDATSMKNGGTGSNQGYYLAAHDAAGLTSIFQTISGSITTPSITLTTATITDTISQYFTAPIAGTIIVQSVPCTGYENGLYTWGTGTILSNAYTLSGKLLTVTGFDFDANVVTQSPKTNGTYGSKLVITYTITPETGFWGGNGVITNGDIGISGAYLNDWAFPQPTVDVPINIPAPKVNDIYVYAGNALTDEILANAKPTTFEEAYPATEYSPWMYSYITTDNITYNVSTEAVNPVTDTTCTVTPVYTGANSCMFTNAAIKVCTPSIAFQDTTIYLGESVTDFSSNTGDVTWYYGTINVAPAAIEGLEPELKYTYDPQSVTPTTPDDVYVNVTKVENATIDLTLCAAFTHTPCNPECSFDSNKGEFIIHIKTCTLTITKVGSSDIDKNASNVFTVTGGVITVNLEVAVIGNNSVTITGLPIGTYTVTENSGWSWRYTSDGPKSATFSRDSQTQAVTDTQSVTVNNTRGKTQWLDGYAWCENLFNSVVPNPINRSPKHGGN